MFLALHCGSESQLTDASQASYDSMFVFQCHGMALNKRCYEICTHCPPCQPLHIRNGAHLLCRYIQAPPARGMFVSRPNKPPRKVQLLNGRPHVTKGNDVWLLRFKEISDRDAAETLRNYKCAPATLFYIRLHYVSYMM